MRRRPGVRRAGYGWLVAVLTTVLLATFAFAGSGDAATAYDAEEVKFLKLLNEYRQQNGLRPMILSDTLTVAAEHHSKDMAEYGFFAHDTEGSSYYPRSSEPWDRMEAEGYRYNTYKGENLAVGYETAEQAMQAWKDSPSHNAAMLDEHYRVMGISRIEAPGSVHNWYWTTDFGGHVDPSAHRPGESPGAPEPKQNLNDAPKVPQEPPVAPERGGGTLREIPRDTGALDDGRMEGNGAWSQEARDGADLILDDGRARLGGYHAGEDTMRQRLRIGADAALSYGLRVRTGSPDPDDALVLRLTDGRGRTVAVLDRYTGEDASEWRRARADLSRYEGRTLYLDLHAKTDGELLTTFYLDDLKLGS